MKNKNKLSAIVILIIMIAMASNAIAQSLGKIGVGNGAIFLDSSTPIFEDATNLRIGIGTTSPSFKLDVSSGDINLHTLTNAYRIGDGSTSNSFPVLWHNGNVEDIFVGVGAGNNFMNHHSHVCVGHLSGTRITIGDSLTFVGDESGTTNDTGSYNTAVGCRALFSNRSASNNVAIGNNALHSLIMWTDDGSGHESENTAVGVDALHDNVAYGACALGYQAGQYNTTGCSLVAIGEQAAQLSLQGNNNMAIGEVALRHNSYLSENVALGKWALEWMDFNPGHSDTCVNDHGFTVYGCVKSFNVAVGNGALRYTNPGSLTLGLLDNGNNNTAIGDHAGANNKTGYNLSFLGYLADVCPACNLLVHNSTAIGANTEIRNSDQMILGNNSVNVGIGLSGNATGPTNKLEIKQGTAGNSGLTFTSLTDAATPVGNTGLGVLAVNNTGKVVYVDNTGLGNYCGATPSNPLKADYEIPLNRHNYYFIGQDIATSDVIVGESSCVNPSPSARMYVHQATTQSYPASFAGEFLNSSDENLAVGVIGIAPQSEYNNIGTVGLSTQSQGISNVGVYGSVNGMAALLGGATNFGVYGFTNTPTNGFVNFAVVGDLGPHVAFPSAPDYAGYFNGDVLSTTGVYATSDSTLKDNIQNINNPISIIKSLKPKSYTFKRQQFESMQLPDGTHYGILAQDLQNVLPDAVKDCIHPARHDSLGNQTYAAINFKAVNNIEIIPFLVGGMQQQQQTIDSLRNQLTQLQQQINNCCANSPGAGASHRVRNSIDVELGSERSIILQPAVPNPFAESTIIGYTVPVDVKEAKIIFFDNLGHVLQTVIINDRGEGQLNVYADNLSSGIYSYSLIADGKVIDTKKMVCSK